MVWACIVDLCVISLELVEDWVGIDEFCDCMSNLLILLVCRRVSIVLSRSAVILKFLINDFLAHFANYFFVRFIVDCARFHHWHGAHFVARFKDFSFIFSLIFLYHRWCLRVFDRWFFARFDFVLTFFIWIMIDLYVSCLILCILMLIYALFASFIRKLVAFLFFLHFLRRRLIALPFCSRWPCSDDLWFSRVSLLIFARLFIYQIWTWNNCAFEMIFSHAVMISSLVFDCYFDFRSSNVQVFDFWWVGLPT